MVETTSVFRRECSHVLMSYNINKARDGVELAVYTGMVAIR